MWEELGKLTALAAIIGGLSIRIAPLTGTLVLLIGAAISVWAFSRRGAK